jgi:hypothetical protein
LTSNAGGGPGGGPGEVTADLNVLDGIRARFEQLAGAFADVGAPLGRGHDQAIDAAGQFLGDLHPGAVKFLLSWRAVFDAARTDCQLVAGNTGKQAVDLQALDTHLAAQVQL